MYKLQEIPEKEVTLQNGVIVNPIATLKDEYGGESHIILDDHCYVLLNRVNQFNSDFPQVRFAFVKHWYPEAVDVMKSLPTPIRP